MRMLDPASLFVLYADEAMCFYGVIESSMVFHQDFRLSNLELHYARSDLADDHPANQGKDLIRDSRRYYC